MAIVRRALHGFLLLSVMMAATPALAQIQRYGDFYYSEASDAFSDESRSGVFTMPMGSNSEGVLIWKCMEDGLNVLYGFGKYLGGDSDNEVLVRFRIDKRAPVERRYWKLTSGSDDVNGRYAFMPLEDVARFTSAALSGTKVAIEVVDPLDGEVLRHEFSLRGLTLALQRLECSKRW